MVEHCTIDSGVDTLGRQAVVQLVRDGICSSAVYHSETVSTNDLALGYVRDRTHKPQGGAVLFLADCQTGGRGRHGRRWQSTNDTLTFSLATPRHRSLRSGSIVGLAVGVAVAQAIEFELAPLRTRLKWPNDVYVDGGKVVGVLIETVAGAADWIVLGVGVNVGSQPDLGADPNAPIVRDLSSSVGRTLHRYALLPAIVDQIVRCIGDLEMMREAILTEFRQRCLLSGQPVTWQERDESRSGLCRGVGDDGELLVETAKGLERLASGEARLVRTT